MGDLPELSLWPRFELTVSAASGVLLRDGIVWVLGDDRAGLDRFRLADSAPLAPVALLPGHADAVLEKKHKPDLEALVDLGDGGVLALGSGSRANRERGFRVRGETVSAIDLSPLYARLRNEIGDLNIEGAVLRGDELLLAHRGVGRRDASRLIRLDASSLLAAKIKSWPASSLREIHAVDLGTLDDTPLAFTDLALDEYGRLHYLAAAENTQDAYLDGHCSGSVIGLLDQGYRAEPVARLKPDVKAEGLCWWTSAEEANHWYVVSDADDPALKATLYELRVPRSD